MCGTFYCPFSVGHVHGPVGPSDLPPTAFFPVDFISKTAIRCRNNGNLGYSVLLCSKCVYMYMYVCVGFFFHSIAFFFQEETDGTDFMPLIFYISPFFLSLALSLLIVFVFFCVCVRALHYLFFHKCLCDFLDFLSHFFFLEYRLLHGCK